MPCKSGKAAERPKMEIRYQAPLVACWGVGVMGLHHDGHFADVVQISDAALLL